MRDVEDSAVAAAAVVVAEVEVETGGGREEDVGVDGTDGEGIGGRGSSFRGWWLGGRGLWLRGFGRCCYGLVLGLELEGMEAL